MKLDIEPIGIIHSPYKEVSDGIPIQGARHPDTECVVKIYPAFRDGLLHLEEFSHVYLLYYFNRSDRTFLRAKPYADETEHGIFAIRSPHRPNHIGLTLVQLVQVDETSLTVKGVDMLDGTPLLDIKPYNPEIDAASHVSAGWMEKAGREKGFDRKIDNSKTWLHESEGSKNGEKNE